MSSFWFDSVKPENIRLWKLNLEENSETFLTYCKKKLAEGKEFDLKIQFPGEFAEKEQETIIEDARIAENDLMVIEYKASISTAWVFYGDGIENEGRCHSCQQYKQCKVECKCKKVTSGRCCPSVLGEILQPRMSNEG